MLSDVGLKFADRVGVVWDIPDYAREWQEEEDLAMPQFTVHTEESVPRDSKSIVCNPHKVYDHENNDVPQEKRLK